GGPQPAPPATPLPPPGSPPENTPGTPPPGAPPPPPTPPASRSRPPRYTPRFCSGPLSTINTTRSGRPEPVTSATATPAPWLSQENQSGTSTHGVHPPLTTPSASRSWPIRYTPRFCSGPLSTMNTTRSGRPDPVTSATALSTPWFSHENQSGTAENAAGSGMPTSGQSTGWPRAKSDGTTISEPSAAIGMRAGGSWSCARPATQQP